jgi:Ca2+-binding EF-hand superfamily protein
MYKFTVACLMALNTAHAINLCSRCQD